VGFNGPGGGGGGVNSRAPPSGTVGQEKGFAPKSPNGLVFGVNRFTT
jgi:hypothetical protein